MKDIKRVYKQIDFPPLTDDQKKELEKLKDMSDEEIDTSDIPEVDFSDASFYYTEKITKTKIMT